MCPVSRPFTCRKNPVITQEKHQKAIKLFSFRPLKGLVWALLVVMGCGHQSVIKSVDVKLNPTGYAPLSASVELTTREQVWVKMRVEGQDGPKSDVVRDFPELNTSFNIPVHGLYAGSTNHVELTFYDSHGNIKGNQTIFIKTLPLHPAMPRITIEQAKRDSMAEGMTFVSYYGHDGILYPQKPFMFDSFGKIRWYLNFQSNPELSELFYEDGMERFSNGNLFFGSGGEEFGAKANNIIYEIDMFGTIQNRWELPGYGFHHEVYEKPDGNFLVTANKLGAPTIEDYILEIDRKSNKILNEWNLNKSLDSTRTAWTTDHKDWFHANAVLYDETDSTIVVSGRTQGVVKLTADNKVVWILAPHKDWKTSPNGQDLRQYLLKPLDGMGTPIEDQAVMQGDVSHKDFDWPWYQHAPMLMPGGDLMVFDNGYRRNFTGLDTYSRAVRYHIDPISLTIQQRWEFGKERGKEIYSRIVGDVDFLEPAGHVLYTAGNVRIFGEYYGKSIEVAYPSGEVIFEATIIPPTAFFDLVTLSRTERLPLYPE